MVLSAAGGFSSPVTVTEAPKQDQVDLVKQTTPKEVETQTSTESYVRQYFADVPIMVQIAKCESHFRQFDSDGDIHRGVQNNQDVGVMQINEHYHLDEATAKNYDIYTLAGNTAFARLLYQKFGTDPWNSSKSCWGKYQNDTLALNSNK